MSLLRYTKMSRDNVVISCTMQMYLRRFPAQPSGPQVQNTIIYHSYHMQLNGFTTVVMALLVVLIRRFRGLLLAYRYRL